MTGKTSAQRQNELRQRRAQEGLTEVRGIYLPPEHHQRLKQMAQAIREFSPREGGSALKLRPHQQAWADALQSATKDRKGGKA